MRRVLIVFCVGVVGALAVPASALALGSISGTVTAAVGGAPIAEVEVCAEGAGPGASFECDETALDGTYTIPGLVAGSYKVEFWPRLDSDYVLQYYDDKPTLSQATPVAVAEGVDTPGIDAALALGGKISGHVTDAASKAAVGGVVACAVLQNEGVGRCGETDIAGKYTIKGLPAGSYEVFFFGGGEEEEEGGAGEYLSQTYDDGTVTPVAVTAGATTEGIDAALTKAGRITGTVTDALSGAGIGLSAVCVRDAVAGEIRRCARTDASGRYSVGGLDSGSYKVLFSPDVAELADDYVQQYYSGASTFAQATPLALTAPAVLTGIDARLVSRKAPVATVTPPAVTPPRTNSSGGPKKPVCKKGKRLVKVKGRKRCVKVHRKHRHRRHHAKRDRFQRLIGEHPELRLR